MILHVLKQRIHLEWITCLLHLSLTKKLSVLKWFFIDPCTPALSEDGSTTVEILAYSGFEP